MCGGYTHRPVLLEECVQGLAIRPDGIYVDGTLGRGGHSEEIAKRLTAGGRSAVHRPGPSGPGGGGGPSGPLGWTDHLPPWELRGLGRPAGPGRGGSSGRHALRSGGFLPQLDDPERGFSYQTDAPLDMRMDREDALTAWTVVNQWPQGELRRILTQYGEERHAGAIASAIVRAREQAPIATTGQLVEVIRRAMPAAALREKQHPAKRSFQAIRIAVNDELGSVSRMLQQAIPRPAPRWAAGGDLLPLLGGPDRQSELAAAGQGPRLPPSFPVCVCGRQPQVRLVSRKPILPSQREIDENPGPEARNCAWQRNWTNPQGNQPDEVE